MNNLPPLSDQEKAIYQWQTWIPGFGEAGQEKLKNACVFISRIGGLGGLVAYQLAAAGVGRLTLAHAGNVKPSDLNRQLLMTHDWLGKPRVESARRRLNELNPHVDVQIFNENVHHDSAARLIQQADLVVDAAPRFEERFAMHEAALERRIPVVECAVYAMELQVFTILPGQTACLRCLYPEVPRHWKRQFPVLGAVSGCAGCLAAVEAVKLVTGLGTPLANRMIVGDLSQMAFRQIHLHRRPQCPACGHL